SPSASRTSSAERRWPKWIGLKLPPSSPTRMMPGHSGRPADRCGRGRQSLVGRTSISYLAAALDEILVDRQFAQPHWAARMETVGRDPGFGTEAELAAVGEARRGVDVNRGRIDLALEARGGILVGGDDRVGKAGAMARDELDRLAKRIDNLDRKDEVQIFGVPVGFGRRFGRGQHGARALASAQLDARTL